MLPEIVLLGLNHKTAPVELRECLAFSPDQASTALDNGVRSPYISEILLISTCNRMEILMTAPDCPPAIDTARQMISDIKQIPVSEFSDALYVHTGNDAVRHVFRVASSLDSMVVGEPQILGQLKDAYLIAVQNKTSGVILNRLLHKTFFVAKRVRSETGIGDHAVSISYAAIELGRKIFGELEAKKVLLIGAGEMAELAVEHLIRNRSGAIFVANRTFERGVELAGRFKGQAIRFEEIPEYLKTVDIVISSTGAPGYILTPQPVKAVMRVRKNRPLFFIDIAVPRDIDPDINRMGNAYVYDIDDLKNVIDENIEDRHREAVKGERIVDEAVIQFRKWYESLDAVPTIVALRAKLEQIAESENQKTFHALKHLSEEDRTAIQRMSQSMINKILHDPMVYLRRNGCYGDKSLHIDWTRKLFNLDNDNQE
jgi:glutamyl-tRNA reductase